MNLRSGGSSKEHLSIINAVLNNDIEGTTRALENPLTRSIYGFFRRGIDSTCAVRYDLRRSNKLPSESFGGQVSTKLLPNFIQERYEVHEWKHACAILAQDFPDEWNDIISVLTDFRLYKSWITNPGGSKSAVSGFIDKYLYSRGWVEKEFQTQVVVDNRTMDTPTHKIDCFRNRVALEIEWNNKDPFYDRDLNNFRLLFDLRAISVGVIVTRCDSLQDIFRDLGRGSSYGASTTHMSKLLPRIEGGGGSGCPILVFGISKHLYVEEG